MPKWEAIDSAEPDYIIDKDKLSAKGNLLWNIHAVTSTVHEASLSQFVPLASSEATVKSYDNDRDLFNALYKLMTFADARCEYNPCTVGPGGERMLHEFRAMFRPNKKAQMATVKPALSAWLEMNKDFDIFGRTLQERVAVPRGFRDLLLFAYPPLKSFSSFKQWLNRAVSPVRAPFYHTGVAMRPLSDLLLNRMQKILDLGMRLATCHGDGDLGTVLAWIDPMARPGDMIGMLKGCSIPVVLRRRQQGGWNIVGDAIFLRPADHIKWWRIGAGLTQKPDHIDIY